MIFKLRFKLLNSYKASENMNFSDYDKIKKMFICLLILNCRVKIIRVVKV